MSSTAFLGDLQCYADRVVRDQGIPALSIAVWHDNALHAAASGILNLKTSVEATADSVFQVGSISKAFTASLIMLLADQGKVELDRPIKNYLPSFHVADPEATETITLRHLLSHTSGLASDFSFGHDDSYEETSAIARYVDRCFLLPHVHKQIGRQFSYSNAAYVMAGRIVEIVSGMSFRQAMEDRILKPLNMTQSLVSPMEVLRFRAAMGHFLDFDAQNNRTATVASSCYGLLGRAPSGTLLSVSAPDLIKFGKAHLSNGRTESGARWMSEESVRLMQERHVSLPTTCSLSEDGWGLGWALTDCQGAKVFGHRGSTIGQEALLQVVPAHGLALAVQSNGLRFGGSPVLQRILTDVLQELVGIKIRQSAPMAQPPETARFTGRFGGAGFGFEVTEQDGQLSARVKLNFSSAYPSQFFGLKSVSENKFAAYTQDGERMEDFTFLEPDHRGIPQCLFWGYQLHRRLGV